MTMASLPKECRAVLDAPIPVSEAAVTIGPGVDAVAWREPGRQVPPRRRRPDRQSRADARRGCHQRLSLRLRKWAFRCRVPAPANSFDASALIVSGGRLFPNGLPVYERSIGLGTGSRNIMTSRLRLALIAHDEKKGDMVAFARAHAGFLAAATSLPPARPADALSRPVPSLRITRLKSGPLGGDQQIGALIAEGKIDALIFFVDPLTPMPHDVDVKALMRLAIVYDIPMALNRATAEIFLGELEKM